MMISPVQVAQFRTAISGLTLAAVGVANSVLAQVGDPNPEVFRDNLLAVTPEVLQPYMTAAGTLAASFYEDARRDAIGGMYLAKPDDELSPGLSDGIVRYAVAPAFGQSTASILSLYSSGLQKAIAGAARGTIAANVQRDKTKVAFGRAPSTGCCAFCAMLASRGAAYTTAHAAGEGNKYHGFCRCVAVPVWEGEELPYDVSRYEAIYKAGFEGGTFDLSHIREATGRA